VKLLHALFLVAGILFSPLLSAQVTLPLQQHKILWADTVYREAVAKKDTNQLAEAYFLYGKAHEAAGDFLKAREFYLKSLAIIEPQGDSQNLARLYQRLANNELSLLSFKESQKYCYLTLEVAKRLNDKRYMEAAYDALALLYDVDWSNKGGTSPAHGNLKDSVAHYKKALTRLTLERVQDTLRYPGDSLYLLQMKIAHANILQQQKNYLRAIQQAKAATTLAEHLKRYTLKMDAMLLLGTLYLDSKQYDKVKRTLQDIEKFHDESAFKESIVGKQSLLVLQKKYYKAIGNWQMAYQVSEELQKIDAQRFQLDRDGAVSRLQIEYETDKKQMQLRVQEEELSLKTAYAHKLSWLVLALLMISAVTIAISILFYRLYRKNQRISKQNELLIREQSHRVKNNFQSISSLLSLQSSELHDSKALEVINESRQRVECMAILHRKLHKDHQSEHAYLPELIAEIAENVLGSYGLIGVKLKIKADPINLVADKAIHFGLLLNELITNSCKYAFPGHPNPALHIACRRDADKKIHLEVADNGLNEYTPTSVKGLGMQLIKLEALQLYGDYRFGFNNGTVFNLRFPEGTFESA
jgi:two-component sensor histidine kinase